VLQLVSSRFNRLFYPFCRFQHIFIFIFQIRQVINQHFLTNPSVWFYGDKHYQVAKDFVDFIEKNLDDDLEVFAL